MLQIEHEFLLPKGYVDGEGRLHREGVMRLATAADEILPLREASVQKNPAYLTVILLSRVVTRLGDLELISPKVIEGLFSADLAYLQRLYNCVNEVDANGTTVTCPHCAQPFDPDGVTPGESLATPSN